MNELISIMQDVAKLATGGSDLARAESRHIDAERERRKAEKALTALNPAAIVAVGSAEHPVERLMGLQSLVAKAVQLVAAVGQVRLGRPYIGLLRKRRAQEIS